MSESARSKRFMDLLSQYGTNPTQAGFAGFAGILNEQGRNPIYQLGKPSGLLMGGNLDLNGRVIFKGQDDFRTENSISIGTDQGEVVIPTVVNGQQLTPEQAIQYYEQTGQHLGTFATPADAEKYAEMLHRRQESYYRKQAGR